MVDGCIARDGIGQFAIASTFEPDGAESELLAKNAFSSSLCPSGIPSYSLKSNPSIESTLSPKKEPVAPPYDGQRSVVIEEIYRSNTIRLVGKLSHLRVFANLDRNNDIDMPIVATHIENSVRSKT